MKNRIPPEQVAIIHQDANGRYHATRADADFLDERGVGHRSIREAVADVRAHIEIAGLAPITHYRRRGRVYPLPDA